MSPVPHPEEEKDRPSRETNNTDIEDADYPNVVINADSSEDDDDDVGGYMGYQVLGQDTYNTDSDDETQETDQAEGQDSDDVSGIQPSIQVPEGLLYQVRDQDFPDAPILPNYMQVPDPPRPEKHDLLWNQPRHLGNGIDTGQLDKIKSVMSGFQLPSINIPDWAKTLSDDQWQAQVVSKLVRTSQEQEMDVSLNQNVDNRQGNSIETKQTADVGSAHTIPSGKTLDSPD